MKAIILVAGFLGGLGSASPLLRARDSLTTHSPVVDLGYSQYQGVALSNDVDEYLGMRYAAPPIRDLRFRGPRDPEQMEGVQDATAVRCSTILSPQNPIMI